jgi:cytochrome c553
VKRWLPRVAAAGALLATAGALVVVSGLVPIKASSGQWAVTDWFLHFAMRRSVATHSLALDAPALDDRNLIVKGATHYELGCRWCHGSPGHEPPRVAQRMTPAPPYLAPRIAQWTPEQLFYIVKHGVKFTGMPAWPSRNRDDEVWAMVAFLLEFPKLDAAGYRRLAFAAASEDQPPTGAKNSSEAFRRKNCESCHGIDGLGRGEAFPILTGQRAGYLRNALEAYADNTRHSGIMEPIAAALDAKQVSELAQYYSEARAERAAPQATDADAIARGEEIAHRGIPAQRVPSCADCHGPNPTRLNDAYPLHAGQHASYLVLQLELFRSGHRGG